MTPARARRRVAPALLAGALLGGDAAADEPALDFFARPTATAATAATPAAPGPRFGARGQLVVDGDTSVSVTTSQSSGVPATNLDFTLSPSLDYFLFRNVSIGLDLDAEYSTGKGAGGGGKLLLTDATTLSGGPRVGVNVPLARVASIWPRFAVGLESIHRVESLVAGGIPGGAKPVASPPSRLVGPYLDLYVPVVLELAPRLFVGVGPEVFHEFAPPDGGPGMGGQRTSVNATALVGGTFGGDSAAPASAPAPRPAKRFGDAHELVFINEDSAGARYTWYAGTSASISGASGTLGADYFVVRYFSLGVAVAASYSRIVGPDPDRDTTVSWSVTPGPRLGVDVPLGRYLSLYPRVLVTLGPGETDRVQATKGETDNTILDLALTATLPLLVHPAPHVFLGAGPTFYHDLLKSVAHATNSAINDQTIVGGELLVGGWL